MITSGRTPVRGMPSAASLSLALLLAACFWMMLCAPASAQSIPVTQRCYPDSAPRSLTCRQLDQQLAQVGRHAIKVTDRLREATDAREVADLLKQVHDSIDVLKDIRKRIGSQLQGHGDGDVTAPPGWSDPRGGGSQKDRLTHALNNMIDQLNHIADTRRHKQDCTRAALLGSPCGHTSGITTEPPHRTNENRNTDAGSTDSKDSHQEPEGSENAGEVEHECPACEAAIEMAETSMEQNNEKHGKSGGGASGLQPSNGVEPGTAIKGIRTPDGRVITFHNGNRPKQTVGVCQDCGVNVANKGVKVTGKTSRRPCTGGLADGPNPCKKHADPATVARLRHQLENTHPGCKDCDGRGVKNGVPGPIKSPITSIHVGSRKPKLPTIHPTELTQVAVTHNLRLSAGRTLMVRGTGKRRALGVADGSGHVSWYPHARLMRSTDGHLQLQLSDHRLLPLQ